MTKLLKGAEVIATLNEKIKVEVENLNKKGINPTLGIIRVGEREDDISYERSAMKRCNTLGVTVKQYLLSANVTQEKLIETISEMNDDDNIHGILMLRPLPNHLHERSACLALSTKKDVDGITDSSMAGVFTGQKQGFPPCTPQACIEILDYYGIECAGKKAVVIGRSLVVGKPVAMMLLEKNATTTVCHTKTVDMPSICRDADILIVAAGREGVITHEYFNTRQIVIDVGINVNEEGKLCGDVTFDDAVSFVEAITPVPGGVGTVTTSVLVGHVVEAAKRLTDDSFNNCN